MSIADLAEKKLLDHKKTFNFGCEIGKKELEGLEMRRHADSKPVSRSMPIIWLIVLAAEKPEKH
jgi:hypothetical protein